MNRCSCDVNIIPREDKIRKMQIYIKISDLIKEEVIQVRRHFHENPEPPWHEENTLRFIKKWADDQRLMKVLELFEGRGGIWFDFVVNPEEPFIIFRADIDALKIQETNDVPYCSKVPGVMHACGHDCHTAMLLLAMREIVKLHEENSDKLHNNIRFVFQRAEESGSLASNSGGHAIVKEDGATNNTKAGFSLHVNSGGASGEFYTRPGSFFANTSRVELKIKTRGGHAGMPFISENALDVMDDLVPILRHFPQRFQSTMTGQVIVNHTIAHAGGDSDTVNIVPTEAMRCWSIRTETDEQQDIIEKEITELCKRHLDGRVLSYDLKYGRGNPAVVNDKELVEKAGCLIGEAFHMDYPVIMAGDDFAFFSREVPSILLMMGTGGIPGKTDIPHHRPNFDVDESVLWKGVWFWILMAKYLNLDNV